MNINQVAIIGLGLIGGSLGLALKRARRDEIEVIGYARRPEAASEALNRRAIDKAASEPGGAVEKANIVVVATPVTAFEDIFKHISGRLAEGAIVTDVGSTKLQVMSWAREHLPQRVSFIGGHPMTGKETTGIEEAEAGLFDGCVYCLTPSANTPHHAVEAMMQVAHWVGATPLKIAAETHDELVAAVSHLPLLVSAALVSALARDQQWADMAPLAASGYRDVTRLASGSPELHHGICSTNRDAIVRWIDRYIDALTELRQQVADDRGLLDSLRSARDTRKKWLENEGRRFQK